MNLLLGVVDGLLLGAATLADGALVLEQPISRLAWIRLVAQALRRGGLVVNEAVSSTTRRVRLEARGELVATQTVRWAQVPRDVTLSPEALAHWFAGAGERGSEGYVVRLRARSPAAASFLAGQLASLYNWAPVARGRVVRLSRSGDRLGFRRLVVGLLPACFGPRLNLRESAPCSPAEAARRRAPHRLDDEAALTIRARVVAGEAYQAIALDFGVSRRTIGKVARGELHGSEDVLRRRAPVRRLTLGEARHAVELARKGLSQRAIALELGTNQPRISRLLRGVCIAL